MSKLKLRILQDRQEHFCIRIFEEYQRSERVLVSTLAEMYIQGVSTRKVKTISEDVAAMLSGLRHQLDQ